VKVTGACRNRCEVAVRSLTASAVLIAATAMSTAPAARADMIGNSFLAALDHAGVTYNDPLSAIALGESVCPMLVQPDETFATVASRVAINHAMSLDKAGLFTVIAISTYCPGMISPLLPDRRQA
jgi:Protein of unknown function (DUF732)